MARPKEWTGFEDVGQVVLRQRTPAKNRRDAERCADGGKADGGKKVRGGGSPPTAGSAPIAKVRAAGRMLGHQPAADRTDRALTGGRAGRARALQDALECCETGDSTLEEPTPSWAIGSETPPGERPSTLTLTPLSRARADLAFDAHDDPFRGTAYRGVRQIGAGGMGEVFLVLHRELGCEFVAKVLRAELRGDARTVDRVRVEAESLGRLQHPHVVSVTDFGYSAEGAPFIVMELLDGMTLAQRMKQGPVTLRDALVFTRATLSALTAAHALGIVHRDIKPHNLFLHQCEDGLIALKVLDFGVARVLPDAPPAAPIPLSLPTQTGMMLGTPRFVSPEAAAGRPVDVRGDLYAVGLVLYQLVAGRGPFDHVRGISDVLHAHTSQVPEPPSWYAAGELPIELDRVVLKALSKRPKHRYQSAAEFDAALVVVQRALVSKARSRQTMPSRLPSQSLPPLRLPSQSLPPLRLPSQSLPPLRLPSQSLPPLRLPSQSLPPLRLPSQSLPLLASASPFLSRRTAGALDSVGRGEASPVARAEACAPTRGAPVAFRESIGSAVRPPLATGAAARAKLAGASASVSADGNAARPADVPRRPMSTVILFVGTLLLTSLMGAGGATLLGRMVGGLP